MASAVKTDSTDKGDSNATVKFWWINSSVCFRPKESMSYIFAYEPVMNKVDETGIEVPREIRIRGLTHNATKKHGEYVRVGAHWTIAFKGLKQVKKGTHMMWTDFGKDGPFEKPDGPPRSEDDSDKACWPTMSEGLRFGAELSMEDLEAKIAARDKPRREPKRVSPSGRA